MKTGQIYVVGVGLDGPCSVSAKALDIIARAHVLIGSERLLQTFPTSAVQRWPLKNFRQTLERLDAYLHTSLDQLVVIVTTGDPLFFGLGRLLLAHFPADQLDFLPSVSSVQLAFSRLKVPWQDATLISVHGRDFHELAIAVRKGHEKIAVLTDPCHSPASIARMILAMDLPVHYQAWVCENLGGEDEQVHCVLLQSLQDQEFASLSVLVLIRQDTPQMARTSLPILGIPDRLFHTFRDRPGLMTKREIRLLALGELALQPHHLCWDIGAGTGSMSVEMARLVTQGEVYAVEKSAMGIQLIEQNIHDFRLSNVTIAHGVAPKAVQSWPQPDRIFIGGSGDQLTDILTLCQSQLRPQGRLVLTLATLENFHQAMIWLKERSWPFNILQAQLTKSVPIADLTRLQPLNPVYLITADWKEGHG